MGLRWKIAIALAAVAAATTITVGVLSYRATSTRLMKEVDRSLDEAFGTIQADYRAAARNRGLLDVYDIQILDRTGQPVGEPDPIVPGPDAEKVIGQPNV